MNRSILFILFGIRENIIPTDSAPRLSARLSRESTSLSTRYQLKIIIYRALVGTIFFTKKSNKTRLLVHRNSGVQTSDPTFGTPAIIIPGKVCLKCFYCDYLKTKLVYNCNASPPVRHCRLLNFI